MGELVIIIYWIAGYLAVPKTIWANKVLIGAGNAIFLRRVALALVFGWFLIPWALIKTFMSK